MIDEDLVLLFHDRTGIDKWSVTNSNVDLNSRAILRYCSDGWRVFFLYRVSFLFRRNLGSGWILIAGNKLTIRLRLIDVHCDARRGRIIEILMNLRRF